MLERLLPDSVAHAETREDALDVELFAVELDTLGRAVDRRRREFTTGRACARAALRRLGVGAVAIPSGPHGEPRWPPGVVGSITHCEGYRACAVARVDAVAALGIDAEPNLPLPEGLLQEVAHGPEIDAVRAELTAGTEIPVDLPRLLFSAKEAVYKAWFPLTGRWLGFEDVEVSFDLPAARFDARLLVSGPTLDGAEVARFKGRWALEEGILGTSVVVPAGSTGARPAAVR